MRKLYSFLIILIASVPVMGQTDSSRPVTIVVDSAKIDTFIQQLEKQTDLRFYYNAAQFDSLFISINVQNQPLRKVLDQVFINTDFQYTIVDEKKLFISKGRVVSTSFPPGFFSGGKVDNATAQQLG